MRPHPSPPARRPRRCTTPRRPREREMLTVRLADGDPLRARVDLLAVALTRDELQRGALRPLERITGRRIRAELERRRFTAAEGSSLLVGGGGRLPALHVLVVG